MTNRQTNDFGAHPSPVDRNRSILWARYRLDSDDWLLMSVRITHEADPDNKEPDLLATVAIVDAAGKVLLESMVKENYIIDGDSITRHGVSQSVVFGARNYESVKADMLRLTEGRDLLVWNADEMTAMLKELDAAHGTSETTWSLHDVGSKYSRYVGEKEEAQAIYKAQPLPGSGVSALSECQSMRKLIVDMASSSQDSDSLVAGRPGWTAEFYKPKLSPAEKLKDILKLS